MESVFPCSSAEQLPAWSYGVLSLTGFLRFPFSEVPPPSLRPLRDIGSFPKSTFGFLSVSVLCNVRPASKLGVLGDLAFFFIFFSDVEFTNLTMRCSGPRAPPRRG